MRTVPHIVKMYITVIHILLLLLFVFHDVHVNCRYIFNGDSWVIMFGTSQ